LSLGSANCWKTFTTALMRFTGLSPGLQNGVMAVYVHGSTCTSIFHTAAERERTQQQYRKTNIMDPHGAREFEHVYEHEEMV
jgi:hypothetical protein